MLIAIVSCNLAWGVIDGVFYILGQLFERGRLRRVWLKITQSTSDDDARSLVADELDPLLRTVTEQGQRQSLYDSIVRRMRSEPVPAGFLTRDDLLGGLTSGCLVFACCFPAVLPFVFIDDPRTALRVSNALLLLLLFLVGYRSAKETMARPLLLGFIFLLVGVVLVAGTIAIGG
jgi:VIT1/CCC1 family predicted Fe2+/Mn2+ transporter